MQSVKFDLQVVDSTMTATELKRFIADVLAINDLRGKLKIDGVYEYREVSDDAYLDLTKTPTLQDRIASASQVPANTVAASPATLQAQLEALANAQPKDPLA